MFKYLQNYWISLIDYIRKVVILGPLTLNKAWMDGLFFSIKDSSNVAVMLRLQAHLSFTWNARTSLAYKIATIENWKKIVTTGRQRQATDFGQSIFLDVKNQICMWRSDHLYNFGFACIITFISGSSSTSQIITRTKNRNHNKNFKLCGKI